MTADGHRASDDEWAARMTRAVRSGSREALAELYDRCAEEVVQSVRKTTRRDESFALDCLQEMFMRLAANPPVVDTYAALLAWMRLAALNVARNSIVAEARRQRREIGAPRAQDGGDPGTTSHDADTLDGVLARLDDDERALLRLRHAEGMRVPSIARAIGATPRAVESALRRLVARVREGGAG